MDCDETSKGQNNKNLGPRLDEEGEQRLLMGEGGFLGSICPSASMSLEKEFILGPRETFWVWKIVTGKLCSKQWFFLSISFSSNRKHGSLAIGSCGSHRLTAPLCPTPHQSCKVQKFNHHDLCFSDWFRVGVQLKVVQWEPKCFFATT